MDFEFKSATDALLAFVRAHQAWAIPAVFVLAFGESLAFISLVLPFFTILIAIGTIIGASGSLNFWSVLVSASCGAALGDWLSYWLGLHYHQQIAAMWPLNKYPDLLPAGERFFKRWGAWPSCSAASRDRCVRQYRSWPAPRGCRILHFSWRTGRQHFSGPQCYSPSATTSGNW